MEWLNYFIEIMLHLDVHLYELVSSYGTWVYAILFMIIFAETGLVVTPFLPGDSLLFAAGGIAATGALDPHFLALLLITAAILGDTVNYWIGYYAGPKVFSRQKSFFFNPQHLQRTHEFYEKYGGKTIIIARFVPIIRTFAPFVAGIGQMSYKHFIFYNVVGAILWVVIFIYGGYLFGNLPAVKRHFSLVIIAIIIISVMPIVIELIRHRRKSDKKNEG
ncbi:MAG: hypothetical protein BWK79_12925 [Beggiatoa sp. IS2]|nr:MAG: hypothetical protein BWK79_12925 [Beggiatoa sp. IS2]